MCKTIITWTEQPQETKVAINVKHCVKKCTMGIIDSY